MTATGLSPATVATLTNELLDVGVLVESRFEDSGGGRPRARLAVNPERGRLIGVDIAETYVHVELFDLAFGVLDARERHLDRTDNDPADVVAHIAAEVDAVLAARAVPRGSVLGVGVSLPGQVDRPGGVSVYAPNWNWHDVPFRSLLGDRVDLPVYVDNPLRASAVAELWFGAGRGSASLVVVTVGTGVGAGIAIDDAVYRGVTNSAGEWGHSCIVLDGRLCRCGSRGCVEAYVGAPGIIQTLRELDAASDIPRPDDETATIDALAGALAEGDPLAAKVATDTSRYLGAALGNLINIVNPDTVVLGGWVMARLGDHLLPKIRAATTQHALPQPLRAVHWRLCALPHNPVSVGAAALALEGFLSSVRPPVHSAQST